MVGQRVSSGNEVNDGTVYIADLIGAIDEIAFQTNLLALNTAVEAAQTGRQDHGFAVVASEVRSLAARCREAVDNVKERIHHTAVDCSNALVDESGETIEEIASFIQTVGHIVSEIAMASRDQSEGVRQINAALIQMDGMVQQNASGVGIAVTAIETSEIAPGEFHASAMYFKVHELNELFRCNPYAAFQDCFEHYADCHRVMRIARQTTRTISLETMDVSSDEAHWEDF